MKREKRDLGGAGDRSQAASPRRFRAGGVVSAVLSAVVISAVVGVGEDQAGPAREQQRRPEA